MPDPLVSIVTPSYNQGAFIRATIESVLAQDYPKIEYIVVDGGSTDETADIVKDYSSRLTWISEKDRGQSHAINKGFRMAKGEIVSWLNSDDIILPGAVSKAVQAFEQHPQAGAVYGEGFCLDNSGTVTARFPATEPFNLWKLVYLSDCILQQTVYLRRSILDEVGFLDENLHYALDWDLWIRIGLKRPMHYIPEYLGCIREYPEAKSFAGGAERIREIRDVLRKYTGMRYPPGYVTYGLQTYRNIWCDWIERWTPALLARKFVPLLSRVCGFWIERTAFQAQGWHADGWAATEVKLMAPPPGEQAVILEGEMPDLGWEQELAIQLNDLPASIVRIKPGAFLETIQVPENLREQPIHLCIRAARHFRGRMLGNPRDARKLAFRLKSVALGDAARAPIESSLTHRAAPSPH